MAKQTDVVVVGAGVAGLTAARELSRGGASVVVLDKARGVGGRCATWRGPENLPLDHGVCFLHGDEPAFLDAVAGVEGTLLPGWPARVEGSGDPCQITAFSPRERRFGVVEGISAFPKTLARDLDVRRQTRVVALEASGGTIRLSSDGGDSFVARDVLLALPCEQTLELLRSLKGASEGIAGLQSLLEMLGTVPCLTVMACYAAEAEAPGWDMLYPRESRVLQLCSHESSKRPNARAPALVLQARASWSRAHLDDDVAEWSQQLLAEAGRLVGTWAARPSWTRAHRWRYARTDLSSELAEPPRVELDGGARLSLAGELFARGAGIEAAWSSGMQIARRIARGEAT
ncbi:MAG: FAD-dependent oxidoreductase [Deltaproteobacteria bacterium]|jgi:predicted NAD/FAD-dependent oxidoreductase|nr:FAD-dependent oxidoreductase [Deltaproteobacteria bacterium]MBW2537336.1 FAD-dependent oxidoreductase [Deltaproteobacteria bacterium]